MFNIYGDWRLFAVLQPNGEGKFRVFVVGYNGVPKEKRYQTVDYMLNHGNIVFDVREESEVKKFIDAGLTTAAPMLLSGVSLSTIGDNNPAETKPFKFNNTNSFVQSKDGFESQYCMCQNCNHPVSPEVMVEMTQGGLDKLNAGETIEAESGEVFYNCGSCGNYFQKTYRNLRIWKTMNYTLSFEEAKKRTTKIKVGDRAIEVPLDAVERLRDVANVEREDEGAPEEMHHDFLDAVNFRWGDPIDAQEAPERPQPERRFRPGRRN